MCGLSDKSAYAPASQIGSIAVVVNDLQPYGSQRVALTLASALSALGHEVELITLERRDRDGLPVPPGIRRTGITRRHGGAAGFLDMTLQMRRHFEQVGPGGVISHMMLSNIVCLAALTTKPRRSRPAVVVTEHNRPSANFAIERSPRALKTLCGRLYPTATRVVGVSNAVVEDVVETFGLEPKQVISILNPVDVAAVRLEARQPVTHEWLATARAAQRTIVCVGAFRHAKGQDVLVRAVARLPDARAVFVGDGPLLPDVIRLAAELGVKGRVDFAGYRSDARALMSRARTLAIPSRWEGFGLVAVEAAAVGTRVVGTAVSGLSQLVPRYVPGELVAPDDPVALAEALQRAMQPRGEPPKPDLSPFSPLEVARAYLNAAVRPPVRT